MKNLTELLVVFPADDIEWRVQRSGAKDGRPWAFVIPYVQNRAIMERLDEVCGPECWRNEYRDWHGGTSCLCGLSIKVGDEWVTKWDGAEDTDIEAIKGGLSNAMKRAAVQWGIGRYLYNCEGAWANFTDNGRYSAKIETKFYKWDAPQLTDKHTGEAYDAPAEPEPQIPDQPENAKSGFITAPQRKKLMAKITELGIDKGDVKDFLGYCLSTTLTSSNDITAEDATALIETLEQSGASIRDRYRGNAPEIPVYTDDIPF